MNTTTAALTVANTILAQINAADFWARARWGVKQMIGEPTALRLVLGNGWKIIVTLAAADTYEVALWRTPRATRKALLTATAHTPIKQCETGDVYADSLVTVIDAMLSGKR